MLRRWRATFEVEFYIEFIDSLDIEVYAEYFSNRSLVADIYYDVEDI